MSNSGTLQRRTTYLISLTLVKVEAIGSDEGTNEETKPQSPTLAPGLVQGPEDGAKTKEEEIKPPEDDKELGRSEMKEQKVEIKKPNRSNNGCPIRTLPPKPKVLSYPPVVSQYKARELQQDTGVPLDGKEKREEEMAKADVSKMDIYIPSSERTSDDVMANGTSVRPSVPIRLIQRPETALRPHATVTMNRREFKDASKTISSSAKSLDVKAREHSPPVTITMTMGPYRASWSESEGRGMYQRLAMEPLMVAEEGLPTRESPRLEKLKTISTSLPASATTRPPAKPQRKGKSRTLDNSDLNLLSEDLKKGKEAHIGAGLRSSTHAPGKDRKMLKFISGIFTKSTQCPVTAPVVPATPIPLHSPLRRRSSEEEVSQEWILSRALQDLHLAVLGSLRSGKSALVHRYMTGRYLALETPEVCRFEKEVLIDGQNHNLLIRDEPGLPDAQLCSWLDGVILVFSLENESSFLEVYNIYRELCVNRNVAEIPFIVVGTQDKITSANPRVIDDARARQLCSDVHRCVYYETCATYGLNVNRVFTDASMLASAHLSADDGAGVYGQRTPFTLSSVHNIDIEGVLSPTLMKDPSTSPTADRKKQRRKKNVTQRSESTLGHAEAKRKMWKLKSFGSLKNINRTDDENCEFLIVSSSGQTWHFEAQSAEERDSWVQNIESQILASLQSCESSRHKARRNSLSEAVAIQAVRNAKGNAFCVDCDAPNPTWASLNLGALICIECSGIHRNLGTHLSRVRSLDLDDWPYELTLVLIAIGNHMTNSIWEKRTRGRQKPRPDATREEREAWIRGKYEQKLFLAPLSSLTDGSDAPLSARLHAAVIDRDLPRLLLLLAHSTKEEINAPPPYMIRYGNGGVHQSQSALHAACQLGDVVMTQLLIWYGSDVRSVDSVGQTALSLARRACSQVCVEILLQYGCPSEISPTMSSASITSPSGAASPSLSRNSSSTSLSRGSNKRQLS
ncbi:hypothetical protein PDJAM_G00260160 [Pangasius djambal]|nr:hypothetical protein [Pangasius djambal]